MKKERALGQHFTTRELARELVTTTLRPLFDAGASLDGLTVLDPAAGEGALLLAARELISLSLGVTEEEVERRCLTGYEIDPKIFGTLSVNLPHAASAGHLHLADWLTSPTSAAKVCVMNPPYGGVCTVTQARGAAYARALRDRWPGRRGKADLSAYFVRKAAESCERVGALTTKSIAEGDSRRISLQWMLASGWVITDATTRFQWPGAAQVIVSMFCATKEQ